MSKRVEFISGFPAETYMESFENHIYNDPEFIKINTGKDPIVYSAVEKETNIILAQWKFTLVKNIAMSPEIGPFGSIEMNSFIQDEVLEDFISFVDDQLRQIGAYGIKMKCHASFQSPGNTLKCKNALIRSGYILDSTDINHHIEVSNKDFISFIHPMEKRRLDKCEKKGMLIRKAGLDELEQVHDFISRCRREKDLEINIEKERFLKVINNLPEHYHIFISLINNEFASATVCVHVNNRILYNYLPASAEKFSSMSPIVMLMEHVYEFAQNMNYKSLDLGISSIDGKPQTGLILFKERIGGITSEKFTFSKSLKD